MPRQRLILIIMATVTCLVTLDSTIVGVALPSMARSLHAPFAAMEWVIGGYVLSFASLLTPAGALGDHRGRRGAVVAGVSIFAVASLLCGVAQSVTLLTAARVLQGVGAAFLPSAALAIIGDTFRGRDRARAFGVWGAALGLAIVCGPIVGGVITGLWGWRWAFLINLPICVALVAAIVRWVPDSRDPHARSFDVAGCVSFAATLFLLTWALIDGHHVAVRLAGAAVMLAAFVVVERRHRSPMLDLALFTRPPFLGAVFAMAGYAAAAQVLIFFLPLYLQNGFGYSPLMCGVAMLPFALPLFLVPRAGAAASLRYGSRAVLVGGLALVAAGDLVLAFAAPALSYPMFATGMLVTGIGAGVLNGETAQTLQGTIPPERGGMAGGLSATVRFTAILLAVALLGVVLSRTATADFARRAHHAALTVDAAPTMRRVIAGDTSSAGVPQSQRATEAALERASVASGIAWLMLAAATVAAVTSALTRQLLPAASPSPRDELDAVIVD